MKKISIGNTGVEVTEVSFGTSALGDMPATYGYSVDEARARETLEAIFESPVNVLDTSRNYGQGRSEQRIGEAIRARGGLPEGFVLSTKLDRDGETNRLDAAQARRSLEESLEALGLDYVGILHLHDPEHVADVDEVTREGGALDELFKMKEEGLADAVGLAMGKIDLMLPIVKDRPFDLIINHNRFNLLNRQATELYDYAHGAGIAVMNAAPYASGALAKGADAAPRIAYQEAGEDQLAPVRQIERICAEHGVPMGAVALQFSARDPRIASTLIGVTKPERVRQTLDWLDTPVPAAVWQALETVPYSTDDPEANRKMTVG
ncbi:aldo/keto reductase [Tranquillimonas alkanivorans]|uniref:D-threo-aldose 1-dehydrogenase n=1 Tax=Tranquillimonas alkanivorans TaxID=441119 RepID=A0A1I5SB26_9RHOB|nr:aldo/keto reductase [Tranquillimonas alkanivorans]SFP67964.1 D-threo-aldose 1-dehydrogenase [Tranquillimonas alkanivorans]